MAGRMIKKANRRPQHGSYWKRPGKGNEADSRLVLGAGRKDQRSWVNTEEAEGEGSARPPFLLALAL